MEKHKCKLCSRSFINGKALGGHMKAHFATFPLPPKLAGPHSLASSSSSDQEQNPHSKQEDDDEEEEEEEEEKGSLVYGLRENPKKSIRLADRGFSFTDSISIVQDVESETESKNPTRRRSKRTRRTIPESLLRWTTAAAESSPVSSVSDTSPEEDVAMCLVMLSMEKPSPMIDYQNQTPESKKQKAEKTVTKSRKSRAKNRCEKCEKSFRSNRAMLGHIEICNRNEEVEGEGEGKWKTFKCPYCSKVFGSGQALGGHKRSHLLYSSARTAILADSESTKIEIGFDLNFPAPLEEDDYSVVSDA